MRIHEPTIIAKYIELDKTRKQYFFIHNPILKGECLVLSFYTKWIVIKCYLRVVVEEEFKSQLYWK